MKFKDIKIGMFVVCKEKHYNEQDWPNWVPLMDDTIGKKMTVIELDTWRNAIRCVPVGDKMSSWWYNVTWLSPWEEEQKGLVGYYQGIDVTGLDHDIIARMAENNDDLCSSKIYNMIAKLNKCKQENPKTARLVNDLIKELVNILDLHEYEEKRDNRPFSNEIAGLKEENKKLKEAIESSQKKKDTIYTHKSYAIYTHKSCSICKYLNLSTNSFPCSLCYGSSAHKYWQPNGDIIRSQLKNLMNNTPEPNMGIYKE